MPIKVITNDNGEEILDYTPAVAEQEEEKDRNPFTGNTGLLGGGPSALQTIIQGLGNAYQAGTENFQETGDIQSAIGAAQASSTEAYEGEGFGRGVARSIANAPTSALQEGSDQIRNISTALNKRGLPTPDLGSTTRENPDAPLLGTNITLQRHRFSEDQQHANWVEGVGSGILQFGLEWITLSRALGLLGKGVKFLPGGQRVASLGQKWDAVEKGVGTAAANLALKKGANPAVANRLVGPAASSLVGAWGPKGGLIDLAGFDPHDGRLFDLDAFKWIEDVPVLKELRSNPDDTAIEGMAKNYFEGVGFGNLAGFAVKSIQGKWILDAIQEAPNATVRQEIIDTQATKIQKGIETEGERVGLLTDLRDVVTPETKLEIQQLENTKADLDARIAELGPEPPKPLKGETKTDRSRAHRRWKTAFNKLKKASATNNVALDNARRKGVDEQKNIQIRQLDEKVQELQREQPKSVAEETLEDTRGKGEFYHGAAGEFELDSSSHYSAVNLWGAGLYTTDDLITAKKYQKKNRKRVEEDAKRTVYKITEKEPVKFFDLDQPVPQDIIEKLEEIQAISEGHSEVIGRTFDTFNIGSWNKSTGKNPSLAEIFHEMRLNNKANNNISAADLDIDMITDIEEFLRGQGFGGFTHQGGKLAGKGERLHQVRIYWDPNEQLNLTKLETPKEEFKPIIDEAVDTGRSTFGVDPSDAKLVESDLMELVGKYNAGEISSKDLYNNVIKVESPTGRLKYGPNVPESALLFDAISNRYDRVQGTGLVSIDGDKMVNEVLEDARAFGLDPDEIETLTSGLRNELSNNVENVQNLLKIRMLVHKTSEAAGIKAMNLLNADARGELDYDQAAAELETAVMAAMRSIRLYQTITRATAQLLKSTQFKIPDNLSDVEIKPRTRPLNLPDPREMLAEADARDAGKTSADLIGKNLTPTIQDAMRTRNWGPEAKAEFKEWTKLVADEVYAAPGEAMGTVQKLIDADKGPLFFNTLITWRAAQILSAPMTWTIQAISPLARTWLEPINYTAVHAVSRNPVNKSAASLVMYQQIIKNHFTKMKLLGQSFRAGTTLFDPKGGVIEDVINQKTRKRFEQGKDITPQRAWDLNTAPLRDHTEKTGWKAITDKAADLLWQAGTIDLRGQAALETYQKAIIGESLAYTIGWEQGLEEAAKEGLVSSQAVTYAHKYANAYVKHWRSDAIVNGKTISDALFNHPDALRLGRILTFTEDIDAKMSQRTIPYGQELARLEGIEGDEAINNYARRYVAGRLPEQTTKLEALKNGRFKWSVTGVPEGEAVLPAGGQPTPWTTKGWTVVPKLIQDGQQSRVGFLVSSQIPFNKSPASMTKQAVRHTPLAFTTDTFYKDLLDENSYISKRWKVEQATGAAVLGSLLTIFEDKENFQITGAGPLNPAARLAWTGAGRLPFSWRHRYTDKNGERVWSQWQSYRWSEPAMLIIGGLAEYNELKASLTQEQRERLGGSLITELTKQVVLGQYKRSYYEQVDKLLQAFFGEGRIAPAVGQRNRFNKLWQEWIVSLGPRSSHMRTINQAMNPEREFVAASNPFTELLDTYKANTPFGKNASIRRNWLNFEPLLNPGFLGDEYMPFEDAPWLLRIGAATVITAIPGALPIGGRRKAGTGYVEEELLRLSGLGGTFMPPRPEDVIPGLRLGAKPDEGQEFSPWDVYLNYLAVTPDFGQGTKGKKGSGKTLYQELEDLMTSKRYQNLEPDTWSEIVESPRTHLVKEIMLRHKRKASFMYKNDPRNPYRYQFIKQLEYIDRESRRKNALDQGLPVPPSNPVHLKDKQTSTSQPVSPY